VTPRGRAGRVASESREVSTAEHVLGDDRSGLDEVLVTGRQDAKGGVAAERVPAVASRRPLYDPARGRRRS
jgi:hypothetical protein